MTQVILSISISVDGYVAGPNQTLTDPLGENGMLLHDWVFGLASWRQAHGLEGGEHGEDDERVGRAQADGGPVVMGRRMYSGGAGPWQDDPNRDGWWGDEPPFGAPVFVVTHHERKRVDYPNGTSFTFVTGGVEEAVARAREVAGDGSVKIAGGGSIASQCLQAGLVDRLELHVAPLVLGGGGVRLFDGVDLTRFEILEAATSKNVTHLSYRVI